jgi:hypothetical protein
VAHGFESRNASAVAQLIDRMQATAADQQHYTAYYGVSGPFEFDAQTLDVHRRAISHMTPAEFLRCLEGGTE